MITMQDVARHAKVSQATVSRVINGSASVNDETKLLVMRSIRELNYQPNLSAKTLAQNKSLIIAIIIPDLMNYFFMDIIYHIEKHIAANGYSLMIFNSDGSKERERGIGRTLRSRQVDGVLAALVSNDSTLKDDLQENNIPTVMITQDHEDFDCVSVSHEIGGMLAARNFLESGYQRFCYAGTSDDPKFAGFHASLRESGVPDDAIMLFDIGKFWFHTGEKAFQVVKDLYPEAAYTASRAKTGFFCINDLIALGFMQALQEVGIVIGSQAGVIGFDDTHICPSLKPRLTSVSQPKEDMARIAVELLMHRMQDGMKENFKFEHIFLDPRLAKRESV